MGRILAEKIVSLERQVYEMRKSISISISEEQKRVNEDDAGRVDQNQGGGLGQTLLREELQQEEDKYKQVVEQQLQSELNADKLLSSALRREVYAEYRQLQQLQAEIQNAQDSLSSLTPKMKLFEIQIVKKDGDINQPKIDLEGSLIQVAILKEELSNVTEERDAMWGEVKRCTAMKMCYDKRIEHLSENVLHKEGQISILKDTLQTQSFELLSSSDHIFEFLVK